MGLDFDQLYPNKYMKAGEFKGKEVTLTIASINLEELGEGKDAANKVVLTFQKTKKLMILNKTNGTCLKGMFGRDTADWIGKRVTFYPTMVSFGGVEDLGIRVRGSPDIQSDMSFSAKLGKRNATFNMKKTGKASAPVKAPPPVEEPDEFGVLPEPGADMESEVAL